MLVTPPIETWSEPIAISGPVIIQARSDGEIFVAWSLEGAMPAGPTEGLRLRDGERDMLGFLSSHYLRVRRGEGTAFAELFIGPWVCKG